MKKYIQPMTISKCICMDNLICTSPVSFGGDTDGNIDSADGKDRDDFFYGGEEW